MTSLRALRLRADNARARWHHARADVRPGRNPAVRSARRLVRARPRGPSSHVLLGDAHQLAGSRNAARQDWRRALELQPGHPNAAIRTLSAARAGGDRVASGCAPSGATS